VHEETVLAAEASFGGVVIAAGNSGKGLAVGMGRTGGSAVHCWQGWQGWQLRAADVDGMMVRQTVRREL
jgi:hypothetical protein